MLPGASSVITAEEIAYRLQEQPDMKGGAVLPMPMLNQQSNPPQNLKPRMASVLVPLLWEDDQWHLLFTRRTETVRSHKGQVSFPGGAAEPQDQTPEITALRETYEEIGLHPKDVQLLGRLSSRLTVTNFVITPVVGQIRWPYQFHLSAEEVGRVFTIPVDWLSNPENREERQFSLPDTGRVENVIYYQPYDGEILWGASARITLDLLQALALL